jgi:response regulator RpfG family c-di-GMP phosphodiesterase
MPGMSGKQFLREAARLPAERRPVMIVNSARRTEEVSKEVDGLEVFDIVSKPFELRDIEERIDRAYEERLRRLR